MHGREAMLLFMTLLLPAFSLYRASATNRFRLLTRVIAPILDIVSASSAGSRAPRLVAPDLSRLLLKSTVVFLFCARGHLWTIWNGGATTARKAGSSSTAASRAIGPRSRMTCC